LDERVLDFMLRVVAVNGVPGASVYFNSASFDLKNDDPALRVNQDEIGFTIGLSTAPNTLPDDRVEEPPVIVEG
jgi:hypothetical protein